MTLGNWSSRMMVSNGNVTGLAERLVAQGCSIETFPSDRGPRLSA